MLFDLKPFSKFMSRIFENAYVIISARWTTSIEQIQSYKTILENQQHVLFIPNRNLQFYWKSTYQYAN